MTRSPIYKFSIAVVCLISCHVKSAYSASPVYGESKKTIMDERISISADQYFQHTDFNKYVGHSVKELLDNIPFRYSEQQGYDEPPGKLAGVSYEFPGGYTVNVETGDLKYTKRFDERRQWNLERFSKERITGIAVHRFGKQPFHKYFGHVYGAAPK